MKNIKCTLCDKKEDNVLFKSKDIQYELGDHNFTLVQCDNCGLIYLNPMPSTELISSYFPDDVSYKTDAFNIYYGNIVRFIKIKKILRFFNARKIENYQRSRIVLDVGCGSGQLLKGFQDRGWQCFGNDLSHEACLIAKKKVKNILQGQLTDCNFENNKFDLVIFHHSFEHVTNPGEEITEVNRILKQGGWLYLGLPNIGSNQFKLTNKFWQGLEIPRHCYHYSTKTISEFLKKNNFSNISITYPIFESPLDIVRSLRLKWRNDTIKPKEIFYFQPLIKIAKKWRGNMDVFARKD